MRQIVHIISETTNFIRSSCVLYGFAEVTK